MKSAKQPSRFNPWPYGIMAFFAFFITTVVLFIIFAVGQDMQLVRADYYEEEIRYQQQIDRESRTMQLTEEVSIQYDSSSSNVEIQLPVSHVSEGLTGFLQFYRPSDADLDHRIKLAPGSNGKQRFSVNKLTAGLWNLHLFWTVEGKEYYASRDVNLK